MNAIEFAEAVADRSFTGYASSGVGLRDKIKSVLLGLLSEYDHPCTPEWKSAMAEARLLERKLEVDRTAHKSTCGLFRITINRLKLARSKAKREAADNAVAYDILRLSISEWESRTGNDHAALLLEGKL